MHDPWLDRWPDPWRGPCTTAGDAGAMEMAAAVGQQLPGQRAVARARLGAILSAELPQQRSQAPAAAAAGGPAGGSSSDAEDSDDDDGMMLPIMIPEDGTELDAEVCMPAGSVHASRQCACQQAVCGAE
jgi:hypothetical protein